jgi:hypothetical protein
MTVEIPMIILILLIVSNTITGLGRTYSMWKAFKLGMTLGTSGTIDFLKKEGLLKEEE